MCCRHRDRGTCGMWNTRTLSSSACRTFVSVCSVRVFLQVLVVLSATNHTEVDAGGSQGTFGVVLSHALQTKEVRLLGPGFAEVDCCAVVTAAGRVHLRTRVRCKSGGRLMSGPRRKTHEETARQDFSRWKSATEM